MRLGRMVFAAAAIVAVLFRTPSTLHAAALPVVKGVEWQPLSAQVKRLIEAMDFLGSPLSADERKAIDAAGQEADPAMAVEKVQAILDGHCLFGVHINPEMRVKVAPGPAAPQLVEQGWRQFLVKVQNESGTTAPLAAVSPNAVSMFDSGASRTSSDQFFRKKGEKQPLSKPADLWLDLQMFDKQPLKASLSGLGLEYRIIQLYSRDAGKREAKFSFNVGQGTQDLGFRNETDVLFDIEAARPVTFRVKDENGEPTTASFLIRDAQLRVYPSQAKRLAPDFAFHPQVYRGDGETVRLPAGHYTIELSRGPESITKTTKVKVDAQTKELSFQVQRWIDPSKLGWWSGDHHIHAAGCAHYVKPTEGVLAEDMIRHTMGEDLKVGANLTWGPCFDYQKQFFCGTVDKVSQYPYLLRYDIEVSGFGSHQSGHLCLLRLKEQMYPGGESKDHWPTLGLNTLKWAKQQGAVTGPAHSGNGIAMPGGGLPGYNIPKYDGIGANEFVVDITHEVPGPDGKLVPAIDFISTVDTDPVAELNMWYHSLNAGFRVRASGETDFPCIYGEKVGLGRSYVKLDGKLDYAAWCEGIRNGRNYVSEGKSHLMEFRAAEVAMGKAGGELKFSPESLPARAQPKGGETEFLGREVAVGEKGSELHLLQAGAVRVTAKVAAFLDEERNPDLNFKRFQWHIEKARTPGTRLVPLEVIVNGQAVAQKGIVADGKMQDVSFDVKIDKSSWVALRILASSHTNPIFVLVDGKPIRASKRSVEWCLKGVDQCWSQKERTYKPAEKEDAKLAYAHAREVYTKLLAECDAD